MAGNGFARINRAYHQENGRTNNLALYQVLVLTSILAFLFLLDILTTQMILLMGGVELNPAMAGIVTSPLLHAIIKCIILIAVVPVALISEARVKRSGVALYAILIAIYIFVMANNIAVLIPQII